MIPVKWRFEGLPFNSSLKDTSDVITSDDYESFDFQFLIKGYCTIV